MPGKGKRGKGKHPQSRRGKAKLRQGIAAPTASTATAPLAPAVPSATGTTAARPALARPAPPTRGAVADVKASAARYPHFVPELRMIGILAIIIIIVLVILSMVLS